MFYGGITSYVRAYSKSFRSLLKVSFMFVAQPERCRVGSIGAMQTVLYANFCT